MNITKITSYGLNGKLKNNTLQIKNVEDKKTFFENRIKDAELMAKNKGGRITYEQTDISLYINYYYIPNCPVFDRLWLVEC